MKGCYIIRGLCGLLILTALVLCSFPLLDYESLRSFLDKHSQDGVAEFYVLTFHKNVVKALFLSGGVLLILALIAFKYADRLLQSIVDVKNDIYKIFKDFKNYCLQVYQTSPHIVYFLLFLCFLGIALRTFYLITLPMRYDEAFTFANYSMNPLLFALSNYSHANNHLFHTFLCRLSYLSFGDEAWALRLPAYIAGCMMIPMVFILGNKLFNKHAGLIAAVCVSVSPFLIDYSVMARGYTIISLIFLVQLLLLQSNAQKPSRGAWLLFAVVSALGFWTIPLMVIPIGVALTFYVMQHFKKDKISCFLTPLPAVFMIFILSLILHAPVFLRVGIDRFINSKVVINMTLSESLLLSWDQMHLSVPTFLTGLMALAFIVSFFRGRRHKKVLHIAFPCVLFSVLFWCLKPVTLTPRMLMFLMPIYYICVGAGIAGILQFLFKNKFTSRLVSVFVISLFMTASTLMTYTKTSVFDLSLSGKFMSAPQAAQFLSNKLKENDAIIGSLESLSPVNYYLYKRGHSRKYIYWDEYNADINSFKNIYLIYLRQSSANNLSEKSFKDVYKKYTIRSKVFSEPELIAEYPDARIYKLEAARLPAASKE